MEKGKNKHGVRTVLMGSIGQDESSGSSSQMGLSGNIRSDIAGDGNMSQVRQSDLCESEPLIHGIEKTKHAGCEIKGATEGEVFGDENLHSGARINLDSAGENRSQEKVPDLLKREKGSIQKEEKPTAQAIQSAPAAIKINSQGLVEAKDNSELLRYCSAMVVSGMVPKQFDTPQKLFGALMYVRSLGLPDTAIRQTANIKGTPTIFADLPLSLAQRTKELTYIKEQWFDKSYNPICFENKNLNEENYGAVCFMARGSINEVNSIQSFSFTLDDAKKSGVYPADSHSPWSKYTRIMLRYKARSIALKSLFPDALNGVSIAEHDFDALDPSEFKDVTPLSSGKKSLNDLLT